MIDLSTISGLPIKYDDEKGKVIYGDGVNCGDEVYVPLDDITPILLNKYLKYPENVYRYHKNIKLNDSSTGDNISYDIVYIPYGLLGIEFIKTHVYHSDCCPGKYDCIVEILSGSLTVMIQKNREKEDPYEFETYVDEMSIITLRKGERLVIPTGVYYTFINTSIVPVIFSRLTSTSKVPIDYATLRREKGLAYFLISKNAKIEVVANPKYKIECQVNYLSSKKILNEDNSYNNEILRKSSNPLFNMFSAGDLMDMIFW